MLHFFRDIWSVYSSVLYNSATHILTKTMAVTWCKTLRSTRDCYGL